MKARTILTSAALAVLLTQLQPVAPLEQSSFADNVWRWVSFFFICLVTGIYASVVRLSIVRRIFSAAIVLFVIRYVCVFLDEVAFGLISWSQFVNDFFYGLLISLLVSVAVVFSLKANDERHLTAVDYSLGVWTQRILIATFCYIALVVIAGVILQPGYSSLADRYVSHVPGFIVVIGVQLIKAFLFIAVSVVITRTTTTRPVQRGVLTGAVFGILGGLAPVIAAEDFPLDVRLAQSLGIGLLNFIYGVFVSWLFRPRG